MMPEIRIGRIISTLIKPTTGEIKAVTDMKREIMNTKDIRFHCDKLEGASKNRGKLSICNVCVFNSNCFG